MAMTSAICKNCRTLYTEPELLKDFIDGVCLPCRMSKDLENYYDEMDTELDIYNQRTGSQMDIDSFYHKCRLKEINKDSLINLPILTDVYEFCREDVWEFGDDPKDFVDTL